jgi:hypothetical protein
MAYNVKHCTACGNPDCPIVRPEDATWRTCPATWPVQIEFDPELARYRAARRADEVA